MKYDKMVELNKKKKELNTEKVRKTINNMLREKKWITVTQLAKETGFTRNYFYHNKEVYQEVKNARRMQRMAYDPDVIIMDKEMEDKLINMQLEILKLKSENKRLFAENLELIELNKSLLQKLETKNIKDK